MTFKPVPDKEGSEQAEFEQFFADASRPTGAAAARSSVVDNQWTVVGQMLPPPTNYNYIAYKYATTRSSLPALRRIVRLINVDK